MNTTIAPALSAQSAVWLTAFGLETLVVIGLNVLTLIVLIKTHSLRRRTTYFLINLSITDLLVGIVPLPMYMCFIGDPATFDSKYMRAAYQSVDIVFGACSIWTLAVISLERLSMVRAPRWHRDAKLQHYLGAIAFSWAIPIAIFLMGFLPSTGSISRSMYLYITLVTLLFIPTTLLVVSHLAMWITFKHRNTSTRHAKQERELSKTLFIITGAFLVTCMPFQALVFYMALDPSVMPSHHLLFALKLLQYGNSFMNPLIYWPRLPGFKSAVRRLFGLNGSQRFSQSDMTCATMKSLRSSRLLNNENS